MKFKEFLKNLFSTVKDGISRFLIAFICSVLLFFTATFEIIFETDSYELIIQLCLAFVITAIFSVLLKLIQEYIWEKLNRVIQYILCAIFAVASFILLRLNFDTIYTAMAYCGVLVALICFMFFVIMRGENKDTVFPKMVASHYFIGWICGILTWGLLTCLTVFQTLIISWEESHKLYLIILLFIWCVVFSNAFLAHIPRKNVPVVKSKIFRIIILFALLPLYTLLIAILLLYLAKIVITRNMPVGEINWYASFASLFFIFILLSVKQYTEKVAGFFVKFGGYFLLPILLMQGIAVFERVNAYGLTTPRTVSLVLMIISMLFIVGAIVIPKHLNKIALASGILVLIVTVTPFNVIDIPIASQTNILKTTLEANGMIENGTVVPNADISIEDKEKIIGAYDYLRYDAESIPDFIPDGYMSLQDIFGFGYSYEDESNIVYCSFASKGEVSISGYDEMIAVTSGFNINIDRNGKSYDIDLKEIAMQLYNQYGSEKKDLDVYVIDEHCSLYFEYLSFELKDGEVISCYFNGYMLIKN